jgi:hypothetical protein
VLGNQMQRKITIALIVVGIATGTLGNFLTV